MNFIFSWQEQNFVLPLENNIHIFAPPCNILYILQVNCKFHTNIRGKREVSQNLLARIVDVGNDEYIVVCNFADRIMSSF